MILDHSVILISFKDQVFRSIFTLEREVDIIVFHLFTINIIPKIKLVIAATHVVVLYVNYMYSSDIYM